MGSALDLEDYHPSVLLHCWLGHLTCKIVSEMTYNVSSGTLNPTIPSLGQETAHYVIAHERQCCVARAFEVGTSVNGN